MARASNQPTFNFLTGTEIVPAQPLRDSHRAALRQPSAQAQENHNTEELKTQLKKLQYELDAIKQERDLSKIQYQQDLRDAQAKAEADFKRALDAQNGGESAARRLEALQREHKEVESRAANEKAALEKRVRDLQADARNLREELEDAQAELAETSQRQQLAHDELEQRYDALSASVATIQTDLSDKSVALQTAQAQLAQQEQANGELEKEIVRLKARNGDTETLDVIRSELTEQVDHIRQLEDTNRVYLAELKQFRGNIKRTEIVEEEKRSLEVKLKLMHDLERQLSEAQLQKRILEDEKKSWTTYLQGQADGELQYDTPEDMAKAFLQERVERLNLVDKLGDLQPKLQNKEESITTLQNTLADARHELEVLRTTNTSSGQGDNKVKARLEKQRNLALKEVEYLRAQLKSFETEETEMSVVDLDERDNKRLQELEAMLDQYRTELQTLHADLSKLEAHSVASASPRKRPREDDAESAERMGELTRRAKTLQDNLSHLQTRNQVLEAELKASVNQITCLKESSKTRTLELRDNPTAAFEMVKMTAITTLREENAELLARLEGASPRTKVVPISTLDSVKQQLDEAKAQVAQSEKKALRLKQIWSSKSTEFREAVASILGWKLDFLPNGRVKATSILYSSSIVDGEEEENSIVFDGEQGTMKVSGGPKSAFAQEIRSQIEFWVEGRKEIPCFLAACTLEFYDRTTKAQKM